MRTDWDHTVSGNGISKSFVATAVGTLFASAALVAMPTSASAFNLGGLVQGAISQYAAGGFRVAGGGHYGRVHEATRHSHRQTDDDDADADATPGSTNTPPPQKDIGAAPRRLSDGGHATLQQAMNTHADEPAFAPSR
jgi:hypothetical protein